MKSEHQRLLHDLALESIKYGLATGIPYRPKVDDFPRELQEMRAAFVTLKRDGHLRGCIGELEAYRPLVESVAENAFNAAFRDSRFEMLQESELPSIEVHLSILSNPKPVSFTSEEDLLSKLRPGRDGVILKAGRRRGTFLPAVWESLPDRHEFLKELKRKAGLKPDAWAANFEIFRYEAEEF